MILYFDNYITSQALNAGLAHWAERVRKGKAEIYRMPSKLDISLYSLASYAVLNWSAVIVKYSIEDIEKTEYFEAEVKKLFPKAIIIRGRSDNVEKFKASAKLLRKLNDEWIFYAGNNDYPFIAPDTKTLAACFKKAKEHKKNHKFVSIYLAQVFEGLGAGDKKTIRHDTRWCVIDENEHCVSALVKGGYFDAIQILTIDLFEHWFFSRNLSKKKVRIFRSDPLENLVDVPAQIVVVPKSDLCSHFDGYSHLVIHGYENPDSLLPPLFIPPGFFEGKIKIAYGYDDYREGWININPSKKNFSFIENNGADMKIPIDYLPLFWKNRVEKIDINPNADMERLEKDYKRHLQKIQDYWRSTPMKKAKMAIMKPIWILTNGLPIWAVRLQSWCNNPDALGKILDERDRGVEGRLKSGAKRLIYSAITRFKKK